jgi:AcrR family transcriptional regulator
VQLAQRQGLRLSLRAIAKQAGVTAALLNYHFADLDGLLSALMHERAQPLWEALFDPRDGNAGAALTRFMQRWTATLLRHRWLLPCLLQVPQGPGHWGLQLRELVRKAQHEGALRGDLPEDYVAMLLLSVGASPQLAGTALGCGITLSCEAAAASQLTLQHLSLLERGLSPHTLHYRPRQESAS